MLSFSRYLQRTELKDYEERVRRDTSLDAAGYPDFKVKPPGDRAEYYIVDYIEPMAGNDNAFGFDLHAEPLRVLALERARDTGEIVASGRLVLVSSRQVGFPARSRLPERMPLRTEKDRRDAFIGVVSATFVIDELIPKVVGIETLQNTRIQIFDAGFFNYRGCGHAARQQHDLRQRRPAYNCVYAIFAMVYPAAAYATVETQCGRASVGHALYRIERLHR